MAEKYIDDFLKKYLKSHTETDKSFARHVLHDIINFINKQDLETDKLVLLYELFNIRKFIYIYYFSGWLSLHFHHSIHIQGI